MQESNFDRGWQIRNAMCNVSKTGFPLREKFAQTIDQENLPPLIPSFFKERRTVEGWLEVRKSSKFYMS